MRCRLARRTPPAVNTQLLCLRLTRNGGHQAKSRDRTYRRKCFTSKSEACDPLQVIEGGDLAGGMTLDRNRQIRSAQAAAVVTNPDECEAGVLDIDIDLPRAGI